MSRPSDAPLVEAAVRVPAERLAEFYALIGHWLRSKPRRSPRRRGDATAKTRPTATNTKYAPLGAHLAHLAGDEATLDFSDVEAVLGVALPATARRHRAWWANALQNAQAVVWLRAGWRVDAVDLAGERVTFAREE